MARFTDEGMFTFGSAAYLAASSSRRTECHKNSADAPFGLANALKHTDLGFLRQAIVHTAGLSSSKPAK